MYIKLFTYRYQYLEFDTSSVKSKYEQQAYQQYCIYQNMLFLTFSIAKGTQDTFINY